jgi:hypothetical protein
VQRLSVRAAQSCLPDDPFNPMARTLTVNACDTLRLTLRRESLVETFRAEVAQQLTPRREPLLPRPLAHCRCRMVGTGEVGGDT